ncbi:hypothetical protein NQ176_g4730 [Zarea fungicola]|uniref:Uncharacterized protein n=1 Tax=Zarea fungicola TaxID=93591 RepID=A0ACC1NDD3_9HYPO|nr:hypothetical protein NQ176_g4730 [Lecanicillium fungicola]
MSSLKSLLVAAGLAALGVAVEEPSIHPNRIEYDEVVTVEKLKTLPNNDAQIVCLLKWRLGICTKHCESGHAKSDQAEAEDGKKDDETKINRSPICTFCERKFPEFYCIPGYLLPPKIAGSPCRPGDESPSCEPMVLPPHIQSHQHMEK